MRNLESPRFHDQLRIATEAATDATQGVAQFAQEGVRSTIAIGSYAAVLIAIWPPMVALLCAGAIPSLLARLANAQQQGKVTEAVASTQRRRFFFRALVTDLRAAKEIRLLGLGKLFHDRLVRALRDSGAAVLAVQRRGALVQAQWALAGGILAAVGTSVVAIGAARGRVSVGDVVLFLAAVVGVQGTFVSLVIQSGQASHGVRLFRYYLAVLDTPDDLQNDAPAAVPVLESQIEFEDVWFRYDSSGPWTLRGLNLVLPAGVVIGLVGPNGSGKSTIVKLLCRLYDPDRGRIKWDGIDLREFSAESLRRRIAATFQDFMTYELSAAENIGLGDVRHLSDLPRIRRAARTALADDVVACLPTGYQTILSRTFMNENGDSPGVTLSGGEWQRIALARMLMREEADLLILDEPSSNLDPFAEHELHEAVRELATGRTRLLISHRMNAIRAAEVIVVLSEGQVNEQGTHDQLMRLNGQYAELFALQASRYQDPRLRLEVIG
jgi:ATP-binding cassette subfamily B protein